MCLGRQKFWYLFFPRQERYRTEPQKLRLSRKGPTLTHFKRDQGTYGKGPIPEHTALAAIGHSQNQNRPVSLRPIAKRSLENDLIWDGLDDGIFRPPRHWLGNFRCRCPCGVPNLADMAHRPASDLDRNWLARKLLVGNPLGRTDIRGSGPRRRCGRTWPWNFIFPVFDRHWMGCLELRGTARKFLQAGHSKLRPVQKGDPPLKIQRGDGRGASTPAPGRYK